MFKVHTEQFHNLPPVDQREALRYASVRSEVDEALMQLFQECARQASDACTPRICYCCLSKGELYDCIPQARACRADSFAQAEYFILFVATVGIEVDRLVMKYSKLSPIKSLFFQAIGAERIERVCEVFCDKVAEEYSHSELTAERRFSPGYGDFSLSAQENIFQILSPQKNIGVALTDSLMMSPSKSVSAVIPLTKRGGLLQEQTCESCGLQTCAYKRD